ncbi:hypothetical protein AB0M25_19860 [Streptomyces griseomycini]|uniref:hypothetical protein n=1 Tax=Streptomyces griseomycini TaxID=66895 RepID=UPI0034137E62
MSTPQRLNRARRVALTRAVPPLAAALAVVLGTPGLAAAAPASSGKDTTYLLAFGDSLSVGYQPDVNKDTHAPTSSTPS